MSNNVKTAIAGGVFLIAIAGMCFGISVAKERDDVAKGELASLGIVHLYIKTQPNVSDVDVYIEEQLLNEYITRFKNPLEKENELLLLETRGTFLHKAKTTKEYVSINPRTIKYFRVTKLGE